MENKFREESLHVVHKGNSPVIPEGREDFIPRPLTAPRFDIELAPNNSPGFLKKAFEELRQKAIQLKRQA